MMIYDRFLIVVWAVLLAFLTVLLLGTTTILSQWFGIVDIANTVNIIFVILSLVFAIIIWCFLPRPLSVFMKIAASLPPLIFVLFIYLK